MKKLIFITLISFGFVTGRAQNVTIGTDNAPKKSLTNSLKLVVDKSKHIAISTSGASVDIEGYEGDAIIIEAVTNKIPNTIPPEAAGLKPIPLNSRPGEDNVINYKLIKDTDLLYQVSISTKCKYLHIKVPNHLFLFSVDMINLQHDAFLSLKNYEGPFQVGSYIQTISISNVAGPFKIGGKADKVVLNNILWDNNTAWPSNIASEYMAPYIIGVTANIDIAIPANLKSTFLLYPGAGQTYSDLNMVPVSNYVTELNHLTLNGGGLTIMASSHGRDIYFRKQH